MSNDDEDNIDDASFDEIRLGDVNGDDDKLRNHLPAIRKAIDSEASGKSGWFRTEFLLIAWGNYGLPVWKAARKIYDHAVKHFTSSEVKIVIARSEAKINNAKASKVDAEAEKILAEAEAIRSAEARKDKLLDFMISKDIDMAAEQRDGILRVVFLKPDGPNIESKGKDVKKIENKTKST